MKEITFELTNYCPNKCPYCSSSTVDDRRLATLLPIEKIKQVLSASMSNKRINLSGGEPLSHPQFYDILSLCKQHSEEVVIYTNAIEHIVFNPSAIDGVHVDANLTLEDNVEQLHVLRRVEQGRQRTRPAVSFSRNWDQQPCGPCEHVVVRPDGKYVKPCAKET